MKKVLIASTYLHLIDSLIIKNNFEDDFFLVYINQNDYFFKDISNFFKDNLFLCENKKDKFNNRIENYKKLLSFIEKINPDEIIVGNDRKIEISILINNYKNSYSYMDDGLHSYILEKQHFFKYSFLEKTLKQFLYKNRLVLPKYIGAENYIEKCYLFKPEFANRYLQNKTLIKLEVDNQFLKQIFKKFVSNETISTLSTASKVIFLPHHKFLTKHILDKLETFIDEKTFIKLHPRDNITNLKANYLPKNVASEFLFPFLESPLYGLKTTSILTAKWLREDLNVFYLGETDRFMEKNGIKKGEF